jgi:transposase
MEKDSLVTLLSQGLSVEKIAKRFGKDSTTVSYWMVKYGLDAPNNEKHAAKGGIEPWTGCDKRQGSACCSARTAMRR